MRDGAGTLGVLPAKKDEIRGQAQDLRDPAQGLDGHPLDTQLNIRAEFRRHVQQLREMLPCVAQKFPLPANSPANRNPVHSTPPFFISLTRRVKMINELVGLKSWNF